MSAHYTRNIPFREVNDGILGTLGSRNKLFYMSLGALALIAGWGIIVWVYQSKVGMGIAGINHPVGWGVYITNFVFWVGIAHSGTLISAILFLVRSKWRDAVSRSTEAMTVFAVLTAALFPLIHLGRVWVFYYMVPYPNQRDLYPNFMSPLVLDLIAILTYLTVSVIFFYFGLIPDAAAARDKFKKEFGPSHWKTKLFSNLAVNWKGAVSQWRHYNKAYLYFAMLATPLVISVHSIVSWDFASSILPGWHSTLFAPYFVAGAIQSGLAMALTLAIPMRRLLKLEELITARHLEIIAKMIILTMLIIAYTYIIEPLIEIYTGDIFHIQFNQWRMTTPWIAWIYYLMIILNVFIPLSFAFRAARKNLKWLFIASLLINAGMWLERYFIVTGSTAHDFLPHNWDRYAPSWAELSISAGMAAFFFLLFLLFTRLLPVISIADFKDYLVKSWMPAEEVSKYKPEVLREPKNVSSEKLYVFNSPKAVINAAIRISSSGYRIREAYAPVKLDELIRICGPEKSPVAWWTVAGGFLGFISGFALTVGSVQIYDLIVGGKHPVSLIPYGLIMFELTVLFGAIANLIAVFYYAKLYKKNQHPLYRDSFSISEFALVVEIEGEKEKQIDEIVMKAEKEARDSSSHEGFKKTDNEEN